MRFLLHLLAALIGVAIAIAFLLWVGEMGETIFNKEACC